MASTSANDSAGRSPTIVSGKRRGQDDLPDRLQARQAQHARHLQQLRSHVAHRRSFDHHRPGAGVDDDRQLRPDREAEDQQGDRHEADRRHRADRLAAGHRPAPCAGVELLVMAHPQHADTGCLCMHAPVRRIIQAASDEDRGAASRYGGVARASLARNAELLAVVEPYFTSLLTGADSRARQRSRARTGRARGELDPRRA